MAHAQSRSGFTLIEVMFVMVTLIVVSGMVLTGVVRMSRTAEALDVHRSPHAEARHALAILSEDSYVPLSMRLGRDASPYRGHRTRTSSVGRTVSVSRTSVEKDGFRTGAASKRGFSLATAMVYIFLVTALLSSVLSLLWNEYRSVKNSTARAQALYAAEAGIHLARHELSQQARGGAAWAGWASSNATRRLVSTLPGPATFDVTVDPATLHVSSIGRVVLPGGSPPVSGALSVTRKRTEKGYAVARWQEIRP